MKKTAMMVVIISILFAQQINATDGDTDYEGSGGAVGEGFRIGKDIERHTQLLDKKMNELVKISSNKPMYLGVDRDLEALHISWKNYIKAECSMIVYTEGTGNSWSSTWSLECESNLLQQRIKKVNTTRKCIDKYLVDNVIGEGGYRCIYNLMPDTLKK